MTWEPNLEGLTGPMFQRIANAMIADILNGKLQPGDRLPGHRELAAKLGITVSTASRAFGEVIQQKLIDPGYPPRYSCARRHRRWRRRTSATSCGGSSEAGQPIDERGHRAPLTTWPTHYNAQ